MTSHACLRLLGAVFALRILFGSAGAQDQPSCSMDQMERVPYSVVEPCSAVLKGNLSPQERGIALLVRGRGYHRTGRLDLAERDYDEALGLIPTNEELHISRANIASRAGDLDYAVRLLRRALELNPENPHVLRAVGASHHWSGRWRRAIEYYTGALQRDPTEAYALLFRSQVYQALGEYPAALEDADALVALDPEVLNRQGYLDEKAKMRDFHIRALHHRGHLLAEIGKLGLAEDDFKAAIAYRGSAVAHTGYAEFLSYHRKQSQAALIELDTALAIEPDFPRAWYWKGVTLAGLKRNAEAFEAFDRSLARDPDNAHALRMRARMHREFGRTEEAVNDFQAAIATDFNILIESIPALQLAGYWRSREMPRAITPELLDAIRACMIDKTCN